MLFTANYHGFSPGITGVVGYRPTLH